jgi:hypothetical protein
VILHSYVSLPEGSSYYERASPGCWLPGADVGP